MNDFLDLFESEFLSYVLSLNLVEGSCVHFGNLDYDFDLSIINGAYILDVFMVALDHYGMPYRNSLESKRILITHLFAIR
jgi:hypothetical protein